MSGTVLEVEARVRAGTCFVVCEGVSRRVPDHLDTMGSAPKRLESHIARDIGASGVAQKLAFGLSGALDSGTMSRVIYDLDRAPEAHDNMSVGTEVMAVAGERDLSPLPRRKRIGYGARSLGWALDEAISPQPGREVPATVYSFSMDCRRAANGLPSVTIESRNDLLSDDARHVALADEWSNWGQAAVTCRNEGAWR